MSDPAKDGDDPTGVKVWINRFWKDHTELNPTHPPWKQQAAGDEREGLLKLFEVWKAEFRKLGVTEAEADAASDRMPLAPKQPYYRNDHLPMLVSSIREMRAAAPPPIPGLAGNTWEDRHRFKEHHKALVDQRNAAWDALDQAERERMKAEIRAENASLTRLERFVEFAAKVQLVPTPEWMDGSAAVPLTVARRN